MHLTGIKILERECTRVPAPAARLEFETCCKRLAHLLSALRTPMSPRARRDRITTTRFRNHGPTTSHVGISTVPVSASVADTAVHEFRIHPYNLLICFSFSRACPARVFTSSVLEHWLSGLFFHQLRVTAFAVVPVFVESPRGRKRLMALSTVRGSESSENSVTAVDVPVTVL